MSLVKNLKFNYKDAPCILEISHWNILDEGLTAILGLSGSGKSTLFKILIGLEPCKGFSWEFKGEDLSLMNISDRRLGVVFQDYHLFPHMTSKKNIFFAAQARKIDKVTYLETFDYLVKELNLNSCLDRKAGDLSGGEKQRVSIARALIGGPRILLLDEAFSSLDEDLKNDSRALIKSVIEYFKIPALLITHDLSDVEQIAEEAYVLKNKSLQKIKPKS